jgi:hypothetical protein
MDAAFDPPPCAAGRVRCDGIVLLHGFGAVDRDSDDIAQIAAFSVCVVRRTGPRPRRLPDDSIRFLERLAKHAERHHPPDPGAAPEALEARETIAGVRTLLAELG